MDRTSSQGPAPDAPTLSQVLGSGPTLRLPSVGPEDAGDYVCRAEPGLSGLGGGAAEARLTVNGEKVALPRRPGRAWDGTQSGQRGPALNGGGRALERDCFLDGGAWGWEPDHAKASL